jgi:hypothetical protein
MLRTNLSTRPFYNDRAVRVGLGVLALVALALTAFNVSEIVRLRSQSRDQRQAIAQNDEQARAMRDKAAAIRRSIDRDKLNAVQLQAREANMLIDRRAFSWTELLNQFQSTLPADVRIGRVSPQVDTGGRMLVAITVYSRRIEDLDGFMDALQNTRAFSEVLSRSDAPQEDGTLHSEVQAYYHPPAGPSTAAPAPASEPGKGGGNASPGNATPGTVAAGGER